MKRVLVSLREEELKAAEEMAVRLRVSRSEVIRRAVSRFAVPAPTWSRSAPSRARLLEICANMDQSAKILAKDKGWDPIAIIRACREGRPPR